MYSKENIQYTCTVYYSFIRCRLYSTELSFTSKPMISHYFLEARCTSEPITLQYSICFTAYSLTCETTFDILCAILHLLPHPNAASTWPFSCLYWSFSLAFLPVTMILSFIFHVDFQSSLLQALPHLMSVYRKKRLTISQSGLGQSSLVVKSSSSVSSWVHPLAFDPFHMSETANKIQISVQLMGHFMYGMPDSQFLDTNY